MIRLIDGDVIICAEEKRFLTNGEDRTNVVEENKSNENIQRRHLVCLCFLSTKFLSKENHSE